MGPGDPIEPKGYVRTDASKESNLEKVHAWISGKNPQFKVPFSEFVRDMGDENKFINTYKYLKTNNPAFQKDYDSFASDMGYTLKKKFTPQDHLFPGEVDLSKPLEGGSQVASEQQPTGSVLEQQLLTHAPVEQPLPDFNQQSIQEIEAGMNQKTPAMVLPAEKPQQFDRPGVNLPPNPSDIEANVAYYKAKRDEEKLRIGLGLAPRDISAVEHGGHIAGQFNKAVIGTFSSFPKAVAIGAQALDRITGNDRPIEDYATYQAGKWIDDTAVKLGIEATTPELQDSFLETDVPNAFGSVIGMIMAGGTSQAENTALKLLGTNAKLAPNALAATKELGGLLSSNMAITGGVYQGVSEFEQAKQAGASDQEAFKVFLKNYAVGLTEVIPIVHGLERINTWTGGGVVNTIKNIAINGGKGAFEEGLQEGVQQYLTNKIAQGSYDPKREEFDDLVRSVGAGAFVGFVLPGIAAASQHMSKAQKDETMRIIHDALLKEQKQPEQNINAPIGDLGKQTVETNEKPKEQPAEVKREPQVPETSPEAALPVQAIKEEPTVPKEVTRLKEKPPIDPRDVEFSHEEVRRQIEPYIRKMVDIEREFKNEGLDIDGDYDEDILVTDSDGEIVGPEDLPKHLKEKARLYEKAYRELDKVAGYDENNKSNYNKVIQKVRKDIIDIPFEELKPQQNAIPERSTEKVPVGQAPGGSQEVVSGVPEPEKTPVPQKVPVGDNTQKEGVLSKNLPPAKETVDGLTVRKHIPNQGSIEASFTDYDILKGVREIPFSSFSDEKPNLDARTKNLAKEINESGEINPLIVAIDKDGPYILEGGHRFDALKSLGKKSFPALVVIDKGAGGQVPAETKFRSPEESDKIMNTRLPKEMRGRIVKVRAIQGGKEKQFDMDAAEAIANFKNKAGLKKREGQKSPMEQLIDCLGGK